MPLSSKLIVLAITLILCAPGALFIIYKTKQEHKKLLKEEQLYGKKYDKLFKPPLDHKYVELNEKYNNHKLGPAFMVIKEANRVIAFAGIFLLGFGLLMVYSAYADPDTSCTILWFGIFMTLMGIFGLWLRLNKRIVFHRNGLMVKNAFMVKSFLYGDILDMHLSTHKKGGFSFTTRKNIQCSFDGNYCKDLKEKITFFQEHLM